MASMNEIEAAAAKPMQFFSHDSDAAQDIKCKKLLKRCGFEGYGRWWRLCELLAATEGHKVKCDTAEDFEILADEIGYGSVAETEEFINELVDIGLVTVDDDGSLYSESMHRRSLYFGRKRAAGRKGGMASSTRNKQS